jgi:NAD(P)-dependent dehydrogenase (short-subunit alcohol dehydrogenase family)
MYKHAAADRVRSFFVLRSSFFVFRFSFFVSYLEAAMSPDSKPLTGQVAVVAGATRGAGRGIARGLAEAGATVYCTGRSVTGQPSPYGRAETIDETAAMIADAGGTAIPVRVDHTVADEVQGLFARVEKDSGRLDVLVNSVAGEDPMMGDWRSFWEIDLANGEAILRQALLSHVITAHHAAPLMMRQRRGLIVEVTENDLLTAGGNVLTQIVKASQKVLATIFASELRAHDVAAVAVTPGFLRSERMLEHFGVTEANWREGGTKDPNFLESESPLYVGRAIAALAQDRDPMKRSGHLFSSWELAREYGFTDYDGRRPDWGMKDVDFSVLPESLCTLILEGLRFQRDWLRVLSARTDQYIEKWAPGLEAHSVSRPPHATT